MNDPRSDAELNRIIAEWMGVTAIEEDDGFWYLWLGNLRLGSGAGLSNDHAWVVFCPNYCIDLNAIHEAEQKLTDNEHINFQWFLFESAYNGSNSQTAERMRVSATARQRAEALVKVIEGGGA